MSDTIYQRLLAIGATIDNHESDLYVLRTPEVSEIIEAFRKERGRNVASTFRSQIDGKVWYELPLLFDPFWESRMVTK